MEENDRENQEPPNKKQKPDNVQTTVSKKGKLSTTGKGKGKAAGN